jgi:hypothetical protein
MVALVIGVTAALGLLALGLGLVVHSAPAPSTPVSTTGPRRFHSLPQGREQMGR